MITYEELNDSQVTDFRMLSYHYNYLFNLMQLRINTRERKKTWKYVAKADDYKLDPRFYRGIIKHLEETNDFSKIVKPFYTFRLDEVTIINGQFLFNDILFTFPQLSNFLDYSKDEKAVASVRFLLIRNRLLVNVNDNWRISKSRRVKNHFHFYNQISDLDNPLIHKQLYHQ